VKTGDKLCASDGQLVATVVSTGRQGIEQFLELYMFGKGKQYCNEADACSIVGLPNSNLE
jgi:hypothetical protein